VQPSKRKDYLLSLQKLKKLDVSHAPEENPLTATRHPVEPNSSQIQKLVGLRDALPKRY